MKFDTEQLNIALALLSHKELHISMKAASVISHMTMQYYKRDFLKSRGVIQEVIKLLNHNIQPIKREIASALYNLIKKP